MGDSKGVPGVRGMAGDLHSRRTVASNWAWSHPRSVFIAHIEVCVCVSAIHSVKFKLNSSVVLDAYRCLFL